VLKHRADRYLQECSSSVPPELRGGFEVIVAVPWQAICDTARGLESDLVVIGSHGYGGVDRLLGTTAANVVNHATCDVLVVREPAPSEPTR